MKNKWILAKNILLPVILGGIIGIIISGFMDYNTLNQPPLSPPGFLFGIVWTILYLLMGIAYGILVYRRNSDETVSKIYWTQLLVNLIWPILFFVFKVRLLSILWIILLLILVINMILEFYKKDKMIAYTQIPYVIWLLFATYLNIGVYLLNK
jgi:benzodiazapine receptor